MKNLYKLIAITALVAVIGFAFIACDDGNNNNNNNSGDDDTVINIAAIAGVTVPVQGATPVTAITANAQYTGTVTWNGTPATFDYATEYVATITLTAKSGYTLQGVSANFFTVAGATAVNAANSGVVTAVFPQTEDDPSLSHLEGDITISPNTSVAINTELTATYSGSEAVSFQWKKDGENIGTASTTNPNKYTPTVAGEYTVTVSVTGYNPKTSDPVNVTSSVGIAPTITTTSLPNGAVGTAYSHTLTATGDTGITWSLETGSLPTNLVLSTAGVISGTPTTAGTYNFTVTATNAVGSHQSMPLSITIMPTGTSMAEAIPLTENQWADGNIPTSSDVQWFVFTATESTQYIHADFGTLDGIGVSGLYVQVYDSSEATSGGESRLYYNVESTTYNTRASRTLTPEETYYIRVSPYSGNSGAYRIGFTASFVPPGGAIPLTENQWADGNIATPGGQQWLVFTATASTHYIHGNPLFVGQLYVQVYNSSGGTVSSEQYLPAGSNLYISRTLNQGQIYYIRARPYYNAVNEDYSGDIGNYWIAFNTSTTPPNIQPPSNAIRLNENQWTEGNRATFSDVQWFVFTATESTQYIHADLVGMGTAAVFVQVYDSSGAAVGSETPLVSATNYSTNTSRTLAIGETYYIRARSIRDYRIGFTDSTTAPAS